jgi:hypothetical protein
MKRLALVLVCAVIAGATAFAERQAAQTDTDALKGVVTSYLEIQSNLATDRFDGIKPPARTLAAQAKTLRQGGAPIAKAAAALEQAADLNAARLAFGDLSDAVIARLGAEDAKEVRGSLRLAYCPMVRKSWMQREEQLRNPYFGKSMLTCGEFRK